MRLEKKIIEGVELSFFSPVKTKVEGYSFMVNFERYYHNGDPIGYSKYFKYSNMDDFYI